MIAKAKKGKSFGGCVRYVLNEGHELLEAEGVDATDDATITRDFAVQRSCRPEIKQPVGHIAVSFAVDDSPRLTNDFMLQLAHEYMSEMGIVNTQYIVVRHHNTDHEHFHIVYNRIDNDLKLISAHNDYHRSGAATKKIKDRHHLTYGVGKEKVNRAKLKGADRVKYQIHDEIAANLPHCTRYKDLTKRLRQAGITVQFKYRSGAEESPENIQGVSFEKSGMKFRGSQIDRRFSHAGLSKAMSANLDEAVRVAMGADYKQGELTEPEGAPKPTPTVATSTPAPEVAKPSKTQAIQQELPLLQPQTAPQPQVSEAPKPSTPPEQVVQAPPAPSPADTDKAKREIREAIEANLPDAVSLTHFDHNLRREGIAIRYKYRNGATETERNIQGVSFGKDGHWFKGSEIDRRYSYANLFDTLSRNRRAWVDARAAKREQQTEEPPRPTDPTQREQTPPTTSSADADKTRREIRDAITANLPDCMHYSDLYERLQSEGITMQFKYRSGAKPSDENIQGVSFTKDGITLNGSDIDRSFSHANLSKILHENWQTWFNAHVAPDAPPIVKPQEQAPAESPRQAQPPTPATSPEPERHYFHGVEITAEQWETVNKPDGHIFVENFNHPQAGKISSYVFLDDEKKSVFYSYDRPDKFVKYGMYEMRVRDKMLIERGYTTKAVVKWSGGTTARPYLWKENPADEDYKISWEDPRLPKEEQDRQRSERLREQEQNRWTIPQKNSRGMKV